jgi:hypothetical protein
MQLFNTLFASLQKSFINCQCKKLTNYSNYLCMIVKSLFHYYLLIMTDRSILKSTSKWCYDINKIQYAIQTLTLLRKYKVFSFILFNVTLMFWISAYSYCYFCSVNKVKCLKCVLLYRLTHPCHAPQIKNKRVEEYK